MNKPLVTVLLVVGWMSVPRPGIADQRPPMNVLLIIADDFRAELGCYGSPLAKTPNLDALAGAGVRFDRAYCQFPLCNPSRSSMLTGRQPTTTGVLGNRTWFGAEHPDLVSLPKYFQQHGYVTLGAGKIFHGGIDDTDAWTEGGRGRVFGEGAPTRPRDTVTSLGLEPPRGLSKIEHNDRWVVLEGDAEFRGDHRVADRTIEFLRKHRDRPFFLGCGFNKPHSPLEAPRRFFDRWDTNEIPLPPDFAPRPTVPEGFPAGAIRPQNADLFVGRDATPAAAREMTRGYLASSAWMDWNVGRVLAELDALGLRERTIIVFWGDHGYQLGEKGKWSKAGSLWEQGIRVPLIIFDPRARGNGGTCPRVVESIDIYSTLCELCGLPPAPGIEGRSLAPLLDEPSKSWEHPAYTVWSEGGRFLTGVSVRTEKWHYAEFFGRGAGAMLLDPEHDPHEMTNFVDQPQFAEVVERLSVLVQEYAAGQLPPDAAERGRRKSGRARSTAAE
jgi:arylsulfatase A-like enzyme